MAVTQAQVNAAAKALVLERRRPTVEAIRQHLGTGSPNTITRMLNVWWVEIADRLDEQVASLKFPAAPPEVVQHASALWEAACTASRGHAEQQLADEHAALATEREAVHAELAALRAQLGDARADQRRLVEALAAADAQGLERERQRTDALAQRDRVQQQLDATLIASRERIDKLEATLAGVRAEHEAQMAYVRGVEARASQEIDRARQEAREVRQALKAATTLGDAAQRRAQALENKLTAAEAKLVVLREQLEGFRVTLARASPSTGVPGKARKRTRRALPAS